MSQTHLIPSNIGGAALQRLAQAQTAQVWGVTSRGVFVHLSTGWTIYLSEEPFRGPLTLNLSALDGWRAAAPGAAVQVTPRSLAIAALRLSIQIDPSTAWNPPPPPHSDLQPAALQSRLETVRRGLSDNVHPSTFNVQPPNDTPTISDRLIANLGLGSGLTPAGDDLALGFLLAANRWKAVLCPALDVAPLNRTLVQAAYERTGTLSANLIECAAAGQADERLILALDGVITGQPGVEACINYLSAWGSSSGAWTLHGMALAFLQNHSQDIQDWKG